MRQVTLNVTGPYRRCPECGHPGDILPFDSVSLVEADDGFEITPHRRGCSRPNPRGGDMCTLDNNQAAR